MAVVEILPRLQKKNKNRRCTTQCKSNLNGILFHVNINHFSAVKLLLCIYFHEVCVVCSFPCDYNSIYGLELGRIPQVKHNRISVVTFCI